MINVSRDGKQIGQYSVSEINKSLASGTLLETDWAWYDGAADWVRITEVEGVTIEAENSLNKQDGEALRESIRDFDAPMGMNEFNFKSYCKSVLAEKTTFGLSLKTKISMMLDKKNVIISRNENDITKEILNLLDKKITKIKLN